MIAFGLKIAWFVLSLTGLICCWAVMWALHRSVGTVWGPLLYGIGCAMMHGMFCLGMIYKMDPFRMPHSFCIAQTVIIAHATFLMNGVAGALSVATSLTVLKPKSWGESSVVALKWRNIYYIPIVIFPIISTAVHIAFIVTFDSPKPSDDLHCDSSDPEWVRFLGYAGLPFLVSIPCMYLTIKSIILVYRTNQHIQRARDEEIDADNFTKSKTRGMRMKNFRLSQHSAPSPIPSAHISGSSYNSLSPSRIARKFHLPFGDSSIHVENREVSLPSTQDTDAASSVSSSFPTFVNPTSTAPFPETETNTPASNHKIEGWRDILGPVEPDADADKMSTLDWKDDGTIKQQKSEFEFENGEGDEIIYETESIPWASKRVNRTLGGMPFKRRPAPPSLAPAIWSIIIFQIAHCSAQVLMCLSTIIDVIRHRSEPTPFGTQHVSLLLSVWGPVLVFGHMPTVRRQLPFWRPFRRSPS